MNTEKLGTNSIKYLGFTFRSDKKDDSGNTYTNPFIHNIGLNEENEGMLRQKRIFLH